GTDLRNLEDFQQNVLPSVEHAIIVLDRAGVLTTWNQTAERLWGLARRARAPASVLVAPCRRHRAAAPRSPRSGDRHGERGDAPRCTVSATHRRVGPGAAAGVAAQRQLRRPPMDRRQGGRTVLRG